MEIDSGAMSLRSVTELRGVGVDVEAVDRFIEADTRLFSPVELAYCAAQANPAESRAGRWCAKEAVAKACSAFLQLSLREIEIVVESSGRPAAVLPARAIEIGVGVALSVAHAGGVAVSIAVASLQPVPSDHKRRDSELDAVLARSIKRLQDRA